MKHDINLSNERVSELMQELKPKKTTLVGHIWTAFLLGIIAFGLYNYVNQLRHGLSITGLRDYFTWGIYISNFVFFVAISLVGSLISAILKLTDVMWRTPLTRIAEVIAVSAIMFAGLIIIVDMGRPERLLNLFIFGRIQSPIMWDVIVVSTYLVISVLLLYLPLIPDIAIMRDTLKDIPKWKQKLYKILALGWNYKRQQYRIVNRCISIFAVLIIPVALSIHTVTSWLFATTFRAGWDSTNFGAYFVSGAFLVGSGGVIAAMYILRQFYGLKKFIPDSLFNKMGKLLVLLALVYTYFNINEYLVPAYKMKKVEAEHLANLFTGHYSTMFWFAQLFGMIIPILVMVFKKGRKPLPAFIVSLFVVVGAWFKRYIIVVPTMGHPFFPMDNGPAAWHHYTPTIAEWSITLASLAGALFVGTMLIRLFPVIPVWEVIEEEEEAKAERLQAASEVTGIKPLEIFSHETV